MEERASARRSMEFWLWPVPDLELGWLLSSQWPTFPLVRRPAAILTLRARNAGPIRILPNAAEPFSNLILNVNVNCSTFY